MNATEAASSANAACICGTICFLLEPEPAITALSPAAESLFGLCEESKNWLQIVRKNPTLLLSAEGIQQLTACIHQTRKTQESCLFIGDLYNVAYQRIPIQAVISRHLADGQEQFCSTVFDLRPEKKERADALKDICIASMRASCEWIGEMNLREKTSQCVYCRSGDKSNQVRVSLDDALSFRISNQVAKKDQERLWAFFKKNARPGAKCCIRQTICFDKQEAEGVLIPCKGVLVSLVDDRFLFSGMYLNDTDASKLEMRQSEESKWTTQSDFETLCRRNLTAKKWRTCFNLLFLIAIDEYTAVSNEQRRLLEGKVFGLLQAKQSEHCVLARFNENCFVVCHHELGDQKNMADCAEKLFQELSTLLAPADGSVSMGVAACPHDPAQGYKCAFEEARTALAEAQKAGGKRYVLYPDHVLSKLDPVKGKRNCTAKGHVVEIITFGYFNVLVDGVPICFSHNKAKELLALLVDRQGGYATAGSLVSYLWENEPYNKLTGSRLRKVVMRLKATLEQYDVADILESSSGMRRIIPEKINCDLYDYLTRNPAEREPFHANYLMDYSWGEDTHGELMNPKY